MQKLVGIFFSLLYAATVKAETGLSALRAGKESILGNHATAAPPPPLAIMILGGIGMLILLQRMRLTYGAKIKVRAGRMLRRGKREI